MTTRKQNLRMNRSNLILTFFILVTFGSLQVALGQTEPAPVVPKPLAAPGAKAGNASGITTKRSKASDRLKLEFEEDLIEGGLENTELNFIQMRKENNFKKMIKIRDNFIPEIEGSSSELGSK